MKILCPIPADKEAKVFRFKGFATPILAASFHQAAQVFFKLKYDTPCLFRTLQRDHSQAEFHFGKGR